MASVAVFVAIGGTSYAAMALPRNSVGAEQIRPRAVGSDELRSGAVRSRAIRNGAIRVDDLAGSTKRSLAGAQGPPGPPGPSAVELRVAVNSAGVPISGNVTGLDSSGTGIRLIAFSRNLTGCVPVASLSRSAGGPLPDPGRVVVAIEGDRVAVETYDAGGTLKYLPFNLIVTC